MVRSNEINVKTSFTYNYCLQKSDKIFKTFDFLPKFTRLQCPWNVFLHIVTIVYPHFGWYGNNSFGQVVLKDIETKGNLFEDMSSPNRRKLYFLNQKMYMCTYCLKITNSRSTYWTCRFYQGYAISDQ